MKTRHVFSSPDIRTTEAVIGSLREAGIPDEDISVIARDDIEKQYIPDGRLETSGDFGRGGMKGVLAGGGSGLLVGLVALTVAPLGLTLAGVAAMTVAGAAVGSWAGMLTGASEPDTVRRTFDDEIAAGRLLVIVDGDDQTLAIADRTLEKAGIKRLPFDTPTAMS
jgi:hypothetical protein